MANAIKDNSVKDAVELSLGHCMSYQEIAKALDISPETVRQIEGKALRKLRALANVRKLKQEIIKVGD